MPIVVSSREPIYNHQKPIEFFQSLESNSLIEPPSPPRYNWINLRPRRMTHSLYGLQSLLITLMGYPQHMYVCQQFPLLDELL